MTKTVNQRAIDLLQEMRGDAVNERAGYEGYEHRQRRYDAHIAEIDAVIAALQDEPRAEPELRHDSPDIQFADVYADYEKGHPVNGQDLINAMAWKIANQRRTLARLQSSPATRYHGNCPTCRCRDPEGGSLRGHAVYADEVPPLKSTEPAAPRECERCDFPNCDCAQRAVKS